MEGGPTFHTVSPLREGMVYVQSNPSNPDTLVTQWKWLDIQGVKSMVGLAYRALQLMI